MKISARVQNSKGQHQVTLVSGDRAQTLTIAPGPSGLGSSVNGGELLFLALATCYCNDLYREAAKRGLNISGVEVQVEGEFGAAGEAARNIRYRVKVASRETEADVRALIQHTDGVAEIHNTLRAGAAVTLTVAQIDESA
ncbi:OsmC family protein [Deinococcus sp.]|uniref:OsmC family protein n=1 Tax=Deinococcus sp. TaxID=47478 RepID=UPI003B5A638E